ncbi:MAG: hypothetical protein VKL23_04940 [Cyanobacteriota bacterium]|nr:hypothetical protein [Cyanobacteriota bacterium]
MADDNNASVPQQTPAEAGREGGPYGGREGRGGRGPQREPGGFRIRLSDNEMRAVRAVQDAFNLRSPVAVLGFCVRTIAQMLEQGQLDDLVAQQRAQGGGRGGDGPRSNGPRGEGPRGDGPRGGGRRPWGEGRQERSAPRIDPMARPQKPAPASVTISDSEPASGVTAESISGSNPTPEHEGDLDAAPATDDLAAAATVAAGEAQVD